MSKFFKNIFLFLAFTMLLYPVMIVFWGEFAPRRLKKNLNYKIGSQGHLHTKLRELKFIEQPDILVVGSSTVYRGYDPRIFKKQGINLFNLGSSAQTPIQTKYLLKNHLLELKPTLLIYDITPLVFTIDGIESSLDMIANDEFNPGLINIAFKVNHLKIYNTLIFAFYAHIFNRYSDFTEEIKRNRETYIKGGYVEYELAFYKKEFHEDQFYEFNENQLKAFLEIISFLKTNNINFLLVQPPIAPAVYHSVQNNDIFDNYMDQHGRYINFNQIINLDDSLHFEDQMHLNKNGVLLYNEKLIEVLLSDSSNLNPLR